MTNRRQFIFVTSLLLLAVSSAQADWLPPARGSPPCEVNQFLSDGITANPNYRAGCIPPINAGLTGQLKEGSLSLGSALYVRGLLENFDGIIVATSSLGAAQTLEPGVKLEVAGPVRILGWDLSSAGSCDTHSCLGQVLVATGADGLADWSDVATISAPAPAPTATLAAVYDSATRSLTVDWSSTDAVACFASGSWPTRGPVATDGNLGLTLPAAAVPTTYTYSLICAGLGGTAATGRSITVAPITSDKLLFCSPASQSGRPGDLFTFAASNSSGIPLDYSWTAGAGTPSGGTGDSFATSYSATGNYDVRLSSPGWVSASCNVDVTVPQPSVDLKVSLNNGVPQDGPVTAYDVDDLELSWTSSNVTSCTASGDWSGSRSPNGPPEAVSNPSNPGSYSYTLTCSDGQSTASDTVVINLVEFDMNTFITFTVDGVKTLSSIDPGTNGTDVNLYWKTQPEATVCQAWTSSSPGGYTIDWADDVSPSEPKDPNGTISLHLPPITPRDQRDLGLLLDCRRGGSQWVQSGVLIRMYNYSVSPPGPPDRYDPYRHHTDLKAKRASESIYSDDALIVAPGEAIDFRWTDCAPADYPDPYGRGCGLQIPAEGPPNPAPDPDCGFGSFGYCFLSADGTQRVTMPSATGRYVFNAWWNSLGDGALDSINITVRSSPTSQREGENNLAQVLQRPQIQTASIWQGMAELLRNFLRIEPVGAQEESGWQAPKFAPPQCETNSEIGEGYSSACFGSINTGGGLQVKDGGLGLAPGANLTVAGLTEVVEAALAGNLDEDFNPLATGYSDIRLDVYGQARIKSGNSGVGKVLTAVDANGLADWLPLTGNAARPVVDITANSSDGPLLVSSGTAVSLHWEASEADTCTSSGTWGDASVNPNDDAVGLINPPAEGLAVYNITCANVGGSTADSVEVIFQQ
ncbi:MAG: hypothetical protein HYT48_02475 [Candidatus Vogelbacteria bacterium]|nr:hypothetical protein [Candidatus Vogelbacteria bacterium]